MTQTNGISTLQGLLGTLGLDGAKTAAKAAAESPAEARVDQAKVSLAGGLVARASAGSDVRTEKVAALQAAIAAGTYKVGAGDVADKLIDSLLG